MSAATLTRTVDGIEIPTPGLYTIDQSHSSIGFQVRHLMVAKVRGFFTVYTGTIVVADEPEQSSVDVAIDAASIDTRDGQRDAHLRSPDFLDVASHPTLTFRSTAVERKGARWSVTGDLTIRDTTRPVVLAVKFDGAQNDPWGGARIAFRASAEIEREEFGLTYNQALETGGVVVGKKVSIEIDVEAIAQDVQQ